MSGEQKSGGGYDIGASVSASAPSASNLNSAFNVVGGGKASQTALVILGVALIGAVVVLAAIFFTRKK